MSKPWTIATACHAYAVPHWSDGYADIDAAGRIVMRPRGVRRRRKALIGPLA